MIFAKQLQPVLGYVHVMYKYVQLDAEHGETSNIVDTKSFPWISLQLNEEALQILQGCMLYVVFCHRFLRLQTPKHQTSAVLEHP